MTVVQEAGKWFVKTGDADLRGPFETNAAAWRWIDKANHEPHNRKEAAHDWSAEQYLKS